MTAKQFIAHDDELIWGFGETPEAALANALDMSSELTGLLTHEATPALAVDVDRRGGAIGFGLLPDGRMGTRDEQYEAA